MTKIYFDMDGTIANLYGVEGWLDKIKTENALPYEIAQPMVNMQKLAKRLNKLQKRGYEIGIITWLAKGGSKEYGEKVAKAKCKWLKKHLATVTFNEIAIVEYGTPKQNIGKGILFDDERKNRIDWGDGAYKPEQIFEVLARLR